MDGTVAEQDFKYFIWDSYKWTSAHLLRSRWGGGGGIPFPLPVALVWGYSCTRGKFVDISMQFLPRLIEGGNWSIFIIDIQWRLALFSSGLGHGVPGSWSWPMACPEPKFMNVQCLGIILRVLRLGVSLFNVYITNQFQTLLLKGGVGE